MPSTTDLVHRHLDTDPTLRDGLERGVLNFRRTARWLLAQTGWEATEEAIVSALRRHSPDGDAITMAMGRELLARAQVGVRSGLALVTLPRELETYEDLRDLWGKVDVEDFLGAFPGDTRVRILLEERSLDTAVRTIGPACLRGICRPVSGIRVSFLGTEKVPRPALSILFDVLGHHDVEVLEAFTRGPECTILVPGSQEAWAHEVVWGLTTMDESR